MIRATFYGARFIRDPRIRDSLCGALLVDMFEEEIVQVLITACIWYDV